MAQLIRAAKSSIHWSAHELLAFNIVIQDVDRATFFGTPRLPTTSVSPRVSPVVLTNITQPPPPAVVTNDERLFFTHLEYSNIAEGGAVHDFTCQLSTCSTLTTIKN
jgi:hypothetical protein